MKNKILKLYKLILAGLLCLLAIYPFILLFYGEYIISMSNWRFLVTLGFIIACIIMTFLIVLLLKGIRILRRGDLNIETIVSLEIVLSIAAVFTLIFIAIPTGRDVMIGSEYYQGEALLEKSSSSRKYYPFGIFMNLVLDDGVDQSNKYYLYLGNTREGERITLNYLEYARLKSFKNCSEDICEIKLTYLEGLDVSLESKIVFSN